MNNAKTTTCPKCSGTGTLVAFRHIANGDCFACGATGLVTRSAVERTAGRAPAYKVVALSIGSVYVTRFGRRFQADHVDGCLWFDIVGGRVVDVELSDGLLGVAPVGRIRSELQAACKANL